MTTPQDRTALGASLRELQTSLPWTIRYSRDHRANPQPHKYFAHALHHVSKAAGKLHALADDMDHDREVADDSTLRERHAKYVADLVVCALRIANVFPGGAIDLQGAVQLRIVEKNQTDALSAEQSRGADPVGDDPVSALPDEIARLQSPPDQPEAAGCPQCCGSNRVIINDKGDGVYVACGHGWHVQTGNYTDGNWPPDQPAGDGLRVAMEAYREQREALRAIDIDEGPARWKQMVGVVEKSDAVLAAFDQQEKQRCQPQPPTMASSRDASRGAAIRPASADTQGSGISSTDSTASTETESALAKDSQPAPSSPTLEPSVLRGHQNVKDVPMSHGEIEAVQKWRSINANSPRGTLLVYGDLLAEALVEMTEDRNSLKGGMCGLLSEMRATLAAFGKEKIRADAAEADVKRLRKSYLDTDQSRLDLLTRCVNAEQKARADALTELNDEFEERTKRAEQSRDLAEKQLGEERALVDRARLVLGIYRNGDNNVVTELCRVIDTHRAEG